MGTSPGDRKSGKDAGAPMAAAEKPLKNTQALQCQLPR